MALISSSFDIQKPCPTRVHRNLLAFTLFMFPRNGTWTSSDTDTFLDRNSFNNSA